MNKNAGDVGKHRQLVERDQMAWIGPSLLNITSRSFHSDLKNLGLI